MGLTGITVWGEGMDMAAMDRFDWTEKLTALILVAWTAVSVGIYVHVL